MTHSQFTDEHGKFDYAAYQKHWRETNPDKVRMQRIRAAGRFLIKNGYFVIPAKTTRKEGEKR